MNTSFNTFISPALFREPDLQADSLLGSRPKDAPGCAYDGPAQIIDVCTSLSEQEGRQYVTAALSLSLIEGLGESSERPILDSQVLYDIHVLAAPGLHHETPTYSYQFRFQTRFINQDRILQSFLGMIQEGEGMTQDFGQTYTVTRMDHRYRGRSCKTILGTGMVSFQEPGTCELEDGHRACFGGLDQDIDIDIPPAFHANRSHSYKNYFHGSDHPPMLILQIPVSLFGGEQHIDGIYATKKSLNWRHMRLNQTSAAAHGGWDR